MTDNEEILAIILSGIIVIGTACGFWWFKSKQEAKIYTKLTGLQVTTWDAMWVKLRVDCRDPKNR